MGNIIGSRKKRTAKVMTIDGSVFRVKPPLHAGDVLKDHPGSDLLDSDDVKLMGVRATRLDANHPIKPGRTYFLVELPRLPDRPSRDPRRAWSGAMHVTAKDRLESLKLSRRSVSDLSAPTTSDGTVRLRVRLPRAQVAELLERTKDPGERAEKIAELFLANEIAAPPPPPPPAGAEERRKEKRTRFLPLSDKMIA